MPVKIQAKKKVEPTKSKKVSTELQDTVKKTSPTQQTTQQTWSSAQWNLDLSNFLSQMTQMMWQQNERMKKLEEQNASTKAVEGEVVKEPEVVVAINEDNVASYNREADDYAEIVNKVWKILYVTAQAPVTRWMQDAAPMMEPVCEKRRVWNQTVSDTKYFPSEESAKAYIENLRKKGITLPGAKIISCYI